MQAVFGDSAAGHDADMTAMEAEQNLETAFMVKADLDQRRDGMLARLKELRAKGPAAAREREQLAARFHQAQAEYTQLYGAPFAPATGQK
jgi:hypothetical protein